MTSIKELRKLYETTDPAEMDQMPPIHPAEILREEFLKPHNLSRDEFARLIRIPRTTAWKLIKEDGRISPELALRLAKLFGTSWQFWLNLQADYDIAILEPQVKFELTRIKTIKVPENTN